MNDRFRFRAWDERTKTCFDNAMIETLAPISTWVKNGWVVEQCTGLKDKNCRLIYENDIVKITGDIMTIDPYYDDKLYVVTYNDLSFGFDMIGEDTEGKGTLYCECWDYEVVGNIHENPELLEDK